MSYAVPGGRSGRITSRPSLRLVVDNSHLFQTRSQNPRRTNVSSHYPAYQTWPPPPEAPSGYDPPQQEVEEPPKAQPPQPVNPEKQEALDKAG